MNEEMKMSITHAVITGVVVGVFIVVGLTLFASRVAEDHTGLTKQIADMRTELKDASVMLQAKQIETNARVIEMRQCEK